MTKVIFFTALACVVLHKKTSTLSPYIPEKEGTYRNRYYVLLCLVTLSGTMNKVLGFQLSKDFVLQKLAYAYFSFYLPYLYQLQRILCGKFSDHSTWK